MQHAVLVVSDWLSLDSVSDIIKDVKRKIAQRRKYMDTVNELSKLNDKELSDIGINRGMIRYIAMEQSND